jgi:hypothetical protein
MEMAVEAIRISVSASLNCEASIFAALVFRFPSSTFSPYFKSRADASAEESPFFSGRVPVYKAAASIYNLYRRRSSVRFFVKEYAAEGQVMLLFSPCSIGRIGGSARAPKKGANFPIRGFFRRGRPLPKLKKKGAGCSQSAGQTSG